MAISPNHVTLKRVSNGKSERREREREIRRKKSQRTFIKKYYHWYLSREKMKYVTCKTRTESSERRTLKEQRKELLEF